LTPGPVILSAAKDLVRGVFRNSSGQYRALWRILAFVGLMVLFQAVLAILAQPVDDAADKFFGIEGSLGVVTFTLALLAAHWVMLRRVELRSWSYVWLDRAAARPKLIGVGTLLGIAPIAIVALSLMAVGWIVVRPNEPGSWLAASAKVTTVLAFAAVGEELMSRGFILAAMSDGMGRIAAVTISSVLFGLAHLGNPGVTAQPIIMVCLAGVELAAILLVTRSLYAASAAHLAWNWVMAVPLHSAVSGLPVPMPGYQTVDAGPDWATGGQWGPEGGVFAGVGMIAVIGYLYVRDRNAKRITQNA
jgi:membrane protease YdiL (CAAX protease family)